MTIPEFSLSDHRGALVTREVLQRSSPALIILLRGFM